jgi:hypothetical protein
MLVEVVAVACWSRRNRWSTGGTGGGGNGAESMHGNGSNAVVNTGGGVVGQVRRTNSCRGAGGSGIVIIKYTIA